MNSNVDSTKFSKDNETNCSNISLRQRHSSRPFQTGGSFDKLLSGIARVAEYVFAAHIGLLAGWLAGVYIGNIYFEYFPPQNPSEAFMLTTEGIIPRIFPEKGAIAGAAASVLLLAIINKRLFIKEVTNLHELGITSSKEIARRLGHSVWRVERTIKKFNKNIKYGKIGIAQRKNEIGITIASASSPQQYIIEKLDDSPITCVT